MTALVPIPRTRDRPCRGAGDAVPSCDEDGAQKSCFRWSIPRASSWWQEAAEAGAERLVIVTSEGKDGVVAHFVEDLVLEGRWRPGARRRCSRRCGAPDVDQGRIRGSGQAVGSRPRRELRGASAVTRRRCRVGLAARRSGAAGGRPRNHGQVRAKRGGTVLCAIEVSRDEISSYGVFDVETLPDADNPNVMRVKGMVEKPKADDAPSLYAAAGRYILDRAIFDALRRVDNGVGGEINSPTPLDC